MDAALVREKLVTVLTQIQIDSGLECPPLTGKMRPVEALPEFDSKVWPVATTILAVEISVDIPDDVNIFVDETTKVARSIDEMVLFVCALAENKKKEQESVPA